MSKLVVQETPLSKYIAEAEEAGFRQVLEIPFEVNAYATNKDDRITQESYFVFWHDRHGILLSFDTTSDRKRLNGGHLDYNWKPDRSKQYIRVLSTGSFYIADRTCSDEVWNENAIWVGNHDCRRSLKFLIRDMLEYGKFVCPWKFRGFLWLGHYEESRRPDFNYKAATASKIAMLPADVREAITPKE